MKELDKEEWKKTVKSTRNVEMKKKRRRGKEGQINKDRKSNPVQVYTPAK